MDQSLKFGLIPVECGSYYPEFLEEALLGEELGSDFVRLEGYHRIQDHYWPWTPAWMALLNGKYSPVS